jgi:hypothetical protein
MKIKNKSLNIFKLAGLVFIGVLCIMIAFTTLTGCVPKIEQTTGEYILNISVNATTFNEGEEIEVTSIFENNSGEERQITHEDPMISIFTLENSESNYFSVSNFSTLDQGSKTTNNFFGSHLKKGKYHLIALASFSFGWGQNDEKVQVYSNTIIITVK